MDSPGARQPMTQRGKSKLKYSWLILFKNDVNEEVPFSVVPLSSFAKIDFPWSLIEGEMSSECRGEIRKIDSLPGEYRFFCKIEKGIFSIC